MLTNFRDLMVHDAYEHFLTDIKNDCFSEMEILALRIQSYRFNEFNYDDKFMQFLKSCIDTKLKNADPYLVLSSLISRANTIEVKENLEEIVKIFKTLCFTVAYVDFHKAPVKKGDLTFDPIFSKEFVNIVQTNYLEDTNTIVLMPLISVLYYTHQK